MRLTKRAIDGLNPRQLQNKVIFLVRKVLTYRNLFICSLNDCVIQFELVTIDIA